MTIKIKRITKKGITVNNTLNGSGSGGVSTGFEYPAAPTTPNRQSQQVQTTAPSVLTSTTVGDGLTAADYIYKNDYNYALSNQQISQQIAADLVTLNRVTSGGGLTTTSTSLQPATSTTTAAPTVTTTSGNLSSIEAAILRSTVPIEISETEEITVNGQRGNILLLF